MIPLLVEVALRSCVLGALLGLALTLTRSRNAHLQKMAWVMVVLASLALPFLLRAHVMPVIEAPDYVVTLQAGHGVAPHSGPAWNLTSAVYELTVLALLCRFACGLLRMWRIRTDARALNGGWTRGLDVRVSAHMRAPATFGSTVLLPAGYDNWTLEKLTAAIAHERAHVINRDCYMLWLARLYACVFWFNPLAWWIQRRLALLAETTSDEAAVAMLGDQPRYAEILLEFAQPAGGGAAPDAAAAMARPNISKRIERILSGVAPSAVPKLSQRVLVMTALLPALAAAAMPLGSNALKLAQGRSAIAAPTANDGAAPGPSLGNFPNLEGYYPREAKRRDVEGMVVIQVILDAAGLPTQTSILSEDPQEFGFGTAASKLAHVMTYRNPAGRPARLAYRVKFALKHGPPARGTPQSQPPTDFEQNHGP